MFVDPKLFLWFGLFHFCFFRNCISFFQVKVSLLFFSLLGKCPWPSVQRVSSWHLCPPRRQPSGVHRMLLLWAVSTLLRGGGLCEDASKWGMQLTCSVFTLYPLGSQIGLRRNSQILTLNFTFWHQKYWETNLGSLWIRLCICPSKEIHGAGIKALSVAL